MLLPAIMWEPPAPHLYTKNLGDPNALQTLPPSLGTHLAWACVLPELPSPPRTAAAALRSKICGIGGPFCDPIEGRERVVQDRGQFPSGHLFLTPAAHVEQTVSFSKRSHVGVAKMGRETKFQKSEFKEVWNAGSLLWLLASSLLFCCDF